MTQQIVPSVVHGTGTGVAQTLSAPGDVSHTSGAVTGCLQVSALPLDTAS